MNAEPDEIVIDPVEFRTGDKVVAKHGPGAQGTIVGIVVRTSVEYLVEWHGGERDSYHRGALSRVGA